MKPDDLDRALTELTTWRGEDKQLWQAAAEAKPVAGSVSFRPRTWARFRNLAAAACLVLVGGALLIGILTPSLGRARHSARVESHADVRGLQSGAVAWSYGQPPPAAATPLAISEKRGMLFGYSEGKESAGQDGLRAAISSDRRDPETDRFVIRKANIDIQTPDVRAAFAKASYLISDVGGEFVENSSLTGEGRALQANLTLRVGAARLSEVLNKLRELGVVKSESTSGEDVTTQVVDVEARIRNEQRVEKELLELLESRKDAPLKDVLDLRNSLSSVRESIERLIGQRDRLGRMVSLASILVVIRSELKDEMPDPADSQGIGAYFRRNMSDAWRSSLRYLVDCVSNIVGLLIGGMIWWAAAVAMAIAALRWRRRLSARCV